MNRITRSPSPRRLTCTLVATASLIAMTSLSAAPAEKPARKAAPGAAAASAAASSAPAAQATQAAASSADHKDIVLDAPAASPAAASGAPSSPAHAAVMATSPGNATVVALNELALNLLRTQSERQGAVRNQAVSPVSLMSAMGMVHAGTGGASAREIAGLLGAPTATSKAFTVRWPLAYRAVAESGNQSGQLGMVNRIWVDQGAAPSLAPTYVSLVKQRYAAEGALLAFSDAERARKTINDWVGNATGERIPELLPAGSIKPNTRLVITNAVHFKAPWEQPFDPAATRPEPFTLGSGSTKNVATMSSQRSIKAAEIDNITVYELPFAGQDFVLRIAMPPKGHTLQALLADQDGADLAGWGSQLKPATCRLSLPRFKLAATTQALKPALQALGVKTVFEQDADFTPMLGQAAKSLHVDDVYQSAMVAIDEMGGEAAAATGATVQAKSFSPLAPACKVDRPFLFAIVHQATQVPVFVGQVADPSQP